MQLTDIRRETACCFTGHRPGKLPGGYSGDHSRLRLALREAINRTQQEGFDTFISGMALGCDTWAAEEVLAMRAAGKPVRLVAARPCPGQERRWSPDDRARYRRLMEQADAIYTACDAYTPYCMGARNLWMVEQASRLIALFDGTPGGTANTVKLAQERRLEIVRLIPDEYV